MSKPVTGSRKTSAPGLLHSLRFANIGAVYIWIAIIVVFSVWSPDRFATLNTIRSVLNENAITGLAALCLLLPLSSRVFDLSIGNAMGFSAIFVTYTLTRDNWPLVVALLVTVVVMAVIGLVNGILVTAFGIDSFILTLATGSLMAAGTLALSQQETIVGSQLDGMFTRIGTANVGGYAVPVFCFVVVAAVLWWIQERTVTGRRIYAVGFNETAARLAGIPVRRYRTVALVVSAALAGVAGILSASQVSSGDPNIGPSYLLPAYAAVFLGSTQFRQGRFNVPGSIVAVLMLGTGSTGLLIVGAPSWSGEVFVGVVLIASLALSKVELAQALRARAVRQRTLDRTEEPAGEQAADDAVDLT